MKKLLNWLKNRKRFKDCDEQTQRKRLFKYIKWLVIIFALRTIVEIYESMLQIRLYSLYMS
jgi:hypothetical protein